jgi:hypothetical protein
MASTGDMILELASPEDASSFFDSGETVQRLPTAAVTLLLGSLTVPVPEPRHLSTDPLTPSH